MRKVTVGIYDKKDHYSIKVVKVYKNKKGNQEAELHFTNAPKKIGRAHVWIEGKHLQEMLKGYKKRAKWLVRLIKR